MFVSFFCVTDLQIYILLPSSLCRYATEVLYWLVCHGYAADEAAAETLGEWLGSRPSYAAVAAAA